MPSKLPNDYVPNKVLAFIDQVVYAREEYKHVMTMALIVSHARQFFGTVPYILATSEKAESGKSTIAFDLPLLLGFNVESIDKTTSGPALNSMYLERITPNLAMDDIGKIYGDNGMNGKMHPAYTIGVKSYRKNATTKMSRNGTMVRVSTYGMIFMNGLRNAVPHDIFTRCIWMQMEPAPEGIAQNLMPTDDDNIEAEARVLKEAIHAWAGMHGPEFKQFMKSHVRRIHPKLFSRKRQIWGPLFAAAYSAGGQWPRWIFEAFVAMALDASEKTPLLPEQFTLLDTANYLVKTEGRSVFTSDLIEALREMPAGQFYRDAEDEYLAKKLFPRALGPAQRVTGYMAYGEHAGQYGTAMGYDAFRVLNAAIELREILYPEMHGELEDPLEAELAFEPVPEPEEVAV
jgi:hypothetical protein